MLKKFALFFSPDPLLPVVLNEQAAKSKYKRLRMQVFLTATLGYGLYYVCRLSINVVKKPLIDSGLLTESQLGIVGSALFFSYAVGKLFNGFLADRSSLRKFMAIGLLLSAIINIGLGFKAPFIVFTVLWGLNGWFQSMGAPPAIISLSRWFSNKDRGTYYGFFSASHNLGEALTYITTAMIVSFAGWQWGFVGAGLTGLLGVIFIFVLLHNSPQSEGLPAVIEITATDSVSIKRMQILVLKNPAIWILAISSSFMYISRYAISSWGIFFLQNQKGYSALEAGTIISVSAISGILGNILSGWVSDKFFKSKRNIPALIFGLLNTLSLSVFMLTPNGNFWLDSTAMAVFGFAIGGLICYLAGLMAVDIVPKMASGAAIGVVGIASYIGAGIQDILSGSLIESHKQIINHKAIYDFSPLAIFWVGSALLSMIVCLFIWNVKSHD